jgi:hypothetical protein
MQTQSPLGSRVPTILLAVSVLLALGGLVAAVSGAADKPANNVAASGATTTSTSLLTSDTTLAGGVTTSTAAGGATGTTAPTRTTLKGSTGTTAPGGGGVAAGGLCGTAPAASADPGPVQPPAVGLYTYEPCADGESSDISVSAGQSGSGVTRRQVTESTEQGGSQTVTEAYGANGVSQEGLTVNAGVGTFACDWDPDIVELPSGLAIGKTWNVDSKCALTQDGKPVGAQLRITGNGKVTGRVQTSVGGVPVTAWVVTAALHLTSPQGSQSIDATYYFDPAHGLRIYKHEETKGDAGSISRVQYLKSLTPRAS